jgi:hypothetical protein
MKSEYLMIHQPLIHQARRELTARGYATGCGATFRGSILAVEHTPADRSLVDTIVNNVDADAIRY